MNKFSGITRCRIFPLLIFLMAALASSAYPAGKIYLEDQSGNDSLFITSGVGSEFTLELKADAALLGFHLYVVHISFPKDLLDTVYIHDNNSLFRILDTGFVIFGKYLRNDSTILRIESMIFGSGIAADGPGLLATIRLRAKGEGAANLDIVYSEVRDVNNDLMTVTTQGAVVFINAPPFDFNLVSPANQSSVFLALEDSLRFVWHATRSPYSGDWVKYELLYGSDAGFDPLFTTSVNNLTDTTLAVAAPSLTGGRLYWKVRAYNSYNPVWSLETDWYCDVSIAQFPAPFSLVSPAHQASLFKLYTENVAFVWNRSTTTNPGDHIVYELHYSWSATFLPSATTILTNLSDTTALVAASTFLGHQRYYWKVKAINTLTYETWSQQTGWYFDLTVGAYPGAFQLTSPGNNAQYDLNCHIGVNFQWNHAPSNIPNDTMTYTIYFGPNANLPSAATFDTSLKISNTLSLGENRLAHRQLHYWRVKATNRIGFDTLSTNTFSFFLYFRGDANGNDIINILDVTYILSYLYKSGATPVPQAAGDSNGNGITNILDATYLLAFLYKQGPAPACP